MSNMKSMEYNYISKRPAQNEQEDINPCEITINIQTSENTMENLTLTTNDDIDEKVDAFCKVHNFTQSVRNMIIQQVEEQIDQKISQMENQDDNDISDNNYYENNNEHYYSNDNQIKSLTKSKSYDNYKNKKSSKVPTSYKKMKKKRTLGKSSNDLGYEMYMREVNRRERRQLHYQKLKAENEEKEQEECTLTPKLNGRSIKILQRSKSQLRMLSTEDRLILQGKEMEKRRLQKIVEKSFNQDIIGDTKNETFIPKINKTPSKQLRNVRSQNIYRNLYEDAKIQNERKFQKSIEIHKQQCTFHPKISKNTEKYVKKESPAEMINRLARKKEDNREIIIKPHYSYQPIITRGPKNPNQRNVTVNLDSTYDKKLLEEKNHIHNNEMCNALEKKQQWLSRSMNIVMKMKIIKYKEIFDLLDGDGDGFVSYDKVKLSDVDNSILIAITPLLEEITKNKEEMMTFKEFVVIADKYIANQIFQK